MTSWCYLGHTSSFSPFGQAHEPPAAFGDTATANDIIIHPNSSVASDAAGGWSCFGPV